MGLVLGARRRPLRASAQEIDPPIRVSDVPLVRAFVILALFALGCEADEVRLLEVDAITPEAIEAGTTLEVEGAGFPAGRDAELRLRGRLFRPGAPPHDVSLTLRGRATSSTRIVLEVEDATIRRAGGRGTLRGELDVVFDGQGRDAVVGVMPVVLDVSPRTAETLDHLRADEERAVALTEDLGWRLARAADDETGLAVLEVTDGSWADAAGVQPGDRLTAFAGVRLRELRDVQPPAIPSPVARVERPGRRGDVALALPVGRPTPTLRGPAAWLALGLALLLAILAATLGPLAGTFRGPERDLSGAALVALALALAVGLVAVPLPPLLLGLGAIAARLTARHPWRVTPLAILAGLCWWCVGLPRSDLLVATHPELAIVALAAILGVPRERNLRDGVRRGLELAAVVAMLLPDVPLAWKLGVVGLATALSVLRPRNQGLASALAAVGLAAGVLLQWFPEATPPPPLALGAFGLVVAWMLVSALPRRPAEHVHLYL